MKGNSGLGIIIAGSLAMLAGAKYVSNKYKNFKTKQQVAKTKSENDDKIIAAQSKLIDELEKKLKKYES